MFSGNVSLSMFKVKLFEWTFSVIFLRPVIHTRHLGIAFSGIAVKVIRTRLKRRQ